MLMFDSPIAGMHSAGIAQGTGLANLRKVVSPQLTCSSFICTQGSVEEIFSRSNAVGIDRATFEGYRHGIFQSNRDLKYALLVSPLPLS